MEKFEASGPPSSSSSATATATTTPSFLRETFVALTPSGEELIVALKKNSSTALHSAPEVSISKQPNGSALSASWVVSS